MANEKDFDLFSWSALEYEEKERSVDWFWALGIIVVAGSVASILFKNYFFAMLLIIAGVLLGFFAIKKPETVNFALTNKGFKMRARIYPYEELKAFWIQIEVTQKDIKKPTLFLKSKRIFLPILSIPIDEEIAPKIKEILTKKNLPEEEMHDHISDRIMENLGF